MLPDPDLCPECDARGRVYDSRNDGRGYRQRRHACPQGHRWVSWQTIVSPDDQHKIWRTDSLPNR